MSPVGGARSKDYLLNIPPFQDNGFSSRHTIPNSNCFNLHQFQNFAQNQSTLRVCLYANLEISLIHRKHTFCKYGRVCPFFSQNDVISRANICFTTNLRLSLTEVKKSPHTKVPTYHFKLMSSFYSSHTISAAASASAAASLSVPRPPQSASRKRVTNSVFHHDKSKKP